MGTLQRYFLDKALRGFHDLLDGNQFHTFHQNRIHTMALEARGARNAGAQDDVLFAVGAGQGRVGGAEYADDRRANSGGDVHRPAVVGDDDGAAPIKFRELEEVGLPGEIAATLGDSVDRVTFAAGAGEDNPFARQSPNEFGKSLVAPELGFPASRGIHGNEAFGFDLCRDAKREFNGIGYATEMACREEVAVNGVGARNINDFVIEEPGAFAGVRQANASRSARETRDQSAAEESLKVNDDVKMVLAQAVHEGGKFRILMAGKRDNFVDDR